MPHDASKTKSRKKALTAEPRSADAATSEPFVGRWNRLVSRTNWEKGRIICEWRDALVEEGAPASEFSDEAWAARVGGVSGQHVGRLRRVHLRFAGVAEEYEGLSWSHFFAALDWSDAEMWLEGAVQNGWSVSQTRGKRWETLGAPDDLKPNDADIVASEPDEDVAVLDESSGDPRRDPDDIVEETAEVRAVGGVVGESSSGAVSNSAESNDDAPFDADVHDAAPKTTPPVRPFADLPKLPDDLTEAFDQFKVAILSHKMNDWRDVSCDDVLATLNALKSLALAPSGNA